MARTPPPLIPLGYGKFVRADRVFALVPLEGAERGDGRRTLVYVEGVEDPIVASRSEGAIARDLAEGLGQGSPRGRHNDITGQEALFQMERRIALLRGINLGPRNRIAMPELREALAAAGYDNVRTYVQSGNVVLDSAEPPDKLERALEKLINERFELEIPVIVRTAEELNTIINRNPLGEVADNPKRYQVTFLAEALDPARVDELTTLALNGERLVADGRELYAWHPDGVGRSKLAAKLAGTGLKVKATARNWTTVETLLGMARE